MRITESQLRRIIREESRRLVEMPARRAPQAQGGVYTDPDKMPPAPPEPSRKRKIAHVLAPGFLPYGELNKYHGEDLNRFKSQNPRAYEDFLVSLYDMTGDGSTEGLDGQGFRPHLERALTAAGLGGLGDSDDGGVEMQEIAGDAVTRLRSGMREMAEEAFELMVGGLEERGVDPYEGLPTLIRHVRAAEGLSGIADMLEELARNQGY